MRVCLALFILLTFCGKGLAQKSRQEIYNLAHRSADLSYDQLLDFAEKRFSDDEEIARFFYYWMGLHIEYDTSVDALELHQAHYPRETEPQFVFENRKTTCTGFTNLYASFLGYFEITHKTILGYTRHSSNLLKGIKPIMDHVWSAIYIDDQWHLADVTWAFTGIDYAHSRDHYFMTPPAVFANDHLPADDEWFLDGQKLSLEDFQKRPLINPMYYALAGNDDLMPKIQYNESGEMVLYFTPMDGWLFRLVGVDAENKRTQKLKYRLKRIKGAVQITLKNYEPGMFLRLDATRKNEKGIFLTSRGLAFIGHPDWQPKVSSPFQQLSTKQERFKK